MKKLINAKILIVGGAGFVGSNLVFKLLNYKIKNIFIIDNLLSADISNIPKDKRVIIFKGSVTNQNIPHKKSIGKHATMIRPIHVMAPMSAT